MKKGIVKSWKITNEIQGISSVIPVEAEFTVEFPFVDITIRTANCLIRSEQDLLNEAVKVISNLMKEYKALT